MSSLGQLVAGIAHEVNNPVNFIHANLSYIDQYTNELIELINIYQQHYPHPVPEIKAKSEAIELEFLSQDLLKMVASMKLGSERIRNIVKSLRNFARLDESELKDVDIHEGLNNTLMILQHRLNATGDCPNIKVVTEYGNLPLVHCYAGQLNQVFLNIINNAIDALDECHSQQAISQIKISTSLHSSERVRICIADNGVGIRDEVKKHLFDPFFTTKPVGKGTGMGLSISYQIVTQRHQGQLWCVSELEKGTEFWLEIPIFQCV
jgi:signal transduction histidine kinase